MTYIIVFSVIAAAVSLYFFLIATKRASGRMAPFEATLIAHRGLFGEGAPENTFAAFERAAGAGYGIELDVRMTSDSKLVVFHDATLRRMFGADVKVSDLTYEELSGYVFPGTSEKIPLFDDVLKTVRGRVPLIIEVKSEGGCSDTCKELFRALEGYEGIYCMESFDPTALRWFKRTAPNVIRGQLTQNYFKSRASIPFIYKVAMSHLLADFIGRPSFIAYNHRHRLPLSASVLHRLGAGGLAAWTVKSEEELTLARKTYDVIIFDSFIPADHDIKSEEKAGECHEDR